MRMRSTSQLASHSTPRHVEIGVLLGVWAHPDDEAYLSAGLMSVARAAGHRVVVATASKGELGTSDPIAFPPERLAVIREHEAAASLAAVDVREHRWLGHGDGTLSQLPHARGVNQVAELIDDVRPDTVVTFGPDGMTGHADHKAVSGWVTAAWKQTGRRCQLWYATLTPDFHREWAVVNSEVGLWMEGATPPSDQRSDLAFVLHCDERTLRRKFEALKAHSSQTTELIRILGPERYRQWWSTEYFIDSSRRDERASAA